MTTEFVLVRHGQTDWNIDNRYQGNSPTPLNATGKEQASHLADAMRGEHWDVMASSPLPRAWETAMILVDALSIPQDTVIADDRLMERFYGVAEGYTLAERESLYPGDLWEGLESREDLDIRTMSVMDDFLKRFPGTRIVLVTHGTWITSVLETLTAGEFGYGRSIILNTSRTYISHDGDGWHVGEIGVADHLEGVPS